MLIEQQLEVGAPLERVWAFMLDIPSVAPCVPGLSDIQQLDGGTYSGLMSVRIGPIQARLAGTVAVEEQDDVAHTARMRLEAADKRLGGAVNASMRMRLSAAGQGTTLDLQTDARVLGKLGDFGQPVIRRKAQEIAQQFARNVERALRGDG